MTNDKKRNTLPRNLILKKQTELEKVLKSGKRYRGEIFITFVYSSGKTAAAFLVNKRIGNAVKRGRMKRLLREAYRLNKEKFKKKEVVFVIKKFHDNYLKISEHLKTIFEI